MPASERKTLEGVPGQMAQGNVISASGRNPLRSILFPCSIPSPLMTLPSVVERRIRHTMKRAASTGTESDARRSALMAAAQTGDRVAYETLLRDCVSFIVGVARRQGVPFDRTDDVVQEVLLTVHRARATYDPRRSFSAWLGVIVERRAIDILRQMQRRGAREVHAPLAYESHADEAVDVSAGIEHQERVKRISAVLAELPRRQREAVRHLMLDEKSLHDTAVLTGRSKGSLKVNLHRALNALRFKMDRGD
jgi:RNA polymerase sigma factor (sigma-70 family)